MKANMVYCQSTVVAYNPVRCEGALLNKITLHGYIHVGSSWRYSHNNDAIMGATASQITSLTIVYSIVYLDADQRKHQRSVSLAFLRGIHGGPVTRKMLQFDDVIMSSVYKQCLKFIWSVQLGYCAAKRACLVPIYLFQTFAAVLV